MQLGVVFPQTELGGDVAAVRTYATEVERLGYAHLLAYDHVVGADPEVHQDWDGPYDVHTTFHEPFVMFGYIAAITSLELVTGIIILPQRQTVLVAKQAAEVDLLTGGRFRLGIGLGWNAVEYEALGKDFTNRGKRSEEQVDLMRRLWTEQSLSFDGPTEKVNGAGIAPLPVQRPIPVWFGVASKRAFERAGRLGDGWFPMLAPGPDLDSAKEIVDGAAVAAAAIRRRSGWKAGRRGVMRAWTVCWPRSNSGGTPAPPICRSTPCGPASARSTTTSPPSVPSPTRWACPDRATKLE